MLVLSVKGEACILLGGESEEVTPQEFICGLGHYFLVAALLPCLHLRITAGASLSKIYPCFKSEQPTLLQSRRGHHKLKLTAF